MYVNGFLIYPCELKELYAVNISSLPTTISFDYVIKSRYIDLVLPNANTVTDMSTLNAAINSVWASLNRLNQTRVEIKFGDSYFCTSLISNRFNYFFNCLSISLLINLKY
jgi:hypothetical protein